MPNDVKLVLGAGAGGGLVSWAFTIMTGATLGLNVWTALPLCVILGTAAALVAIYVVTPTDTSKTGRLIGFALLCGFLWKPVLDAGRVLITQRVEAAQAATDVRSEVSELRAAAPPAVAAQAQETAESAAELLRSSDQLGNVKVEKEATTRATEAVNVIAETATANPVAATAALDEIKRAAEQSSNFDVAKLAIQKISAIRRVAPREPAPAPERPPDQ
jgi:hypothetical protein